MKTIKLLMICLLVYNTTLSGQNFNIKNLLPLNENLYISTLKYDRNEYGIGFLNNKGRITKEQTLTFFPTNFAFMGDNILVIGAEFKNVKTKAFHATLLNKKVLAIMQENKLFDKKGTNEITSILLKDPLNNFQYMLFRETKHDEGFHILAPNPNDPKILESSSIKLMALNNKLEPREIDIKTEAIHSNFMTACADSHRNIYICSFSEKSITVEKFDSTGKLESKLSSSFSVFKAPNLNFEVSNDLNNSGCLTIATSVKNENKNMAITLFRFDFAANRVLTTGEDILNKSYIKSLKKDNTESKLNTLADIEDLEPVQIIEDKEKIFVIKEIHRVEVGGKGEGTIYWRHGAIITVHNKKNLEKETDYTIDKNLYSYLEHSEGIRANLVNDYLYAITCENSGLLKTSFKTYLIKINLKTGNILKEEIEKAGTPKSAITLPKQVAWFSNCIVIPSISISPGLSSMNYETEFNVVKY